MQRFPDQEACIAHLEAIRWGDKPSCPLCGSTNVARKRDGKRIGRWNCHDCKASFNVLSGTVMQKTKIPLQRWFLAIGLIVNAKKSLSSYQLARDLDMTQMSAWYMMQRIRSAMASNQASFLRGVVEVDETYIGGKPRKRNRVKDRKPAKRGRGTKKLSILGAVERDGDVKAVVTDDLTGRGILRFIQDSVDPEGGLLITDEFQAYDAVKPYMPHIAVNHSEQFTMGDFHTNTIEGFWGLLKRAWYGQHHHYRKQYSPLYVAEAAWKYNHRKDTNGFGSLVRAVFA